MPYIVTKSQKKITVLKYNTQEKKQKILLSRKDINCIDCETLDDVDKLIPEEIKKDIYKNLLINCLMDEAYNIIAEKICHYITNNNNKKIIYNFQTEFYNEDLASIETGDGYRFVDNDTFSPLEFENIKSFSEVISTSGKIEYDYNFGRQVFVPDKVLDLIVDEIFSSPIFIKRIFSRTIENITHDASYVTSIDFSGLKDYHVDYLKYLINSGNLNKNLEKYITKDVLLEYYNESLIRFYQTDFYEFYKYGCELLKIEPQNIEYIEEYNEYFATKIHKAFKDIDIMKDVFIKDFSPSKQNIQKRLNRLKNEYHKIVNEKIINSNRIMNNRLSRLREILKNVLKYIKFCDEKKYSATFPDIDMILWDISKVLAIQYEQQEIRIDLSDILNIDYCVKDLLFKGLDYTITFTYINEETKKNIIELIPTSPELEYPNAREMKRHFVIHYGPTNSGKTYQSIEELKKAKSGVYLGPLRLLALEIQDKLNSSGIPCSLLTGEEEEIVKDACHMSSTVEKLNLEQKYDVCVIDECQMINDRERGFAWTKAILGVQAKTIYLCMAPESIEIIKKLIMLCDDTYELVEHKRRSELMIQSPIPLQKKYIEKGDALIVFSKKKVLQVSAELIKMGIRTSMIYGNLPYSVRKKQVQRFLNGDTDVIVSTNAIGMGINLPVRRIIFLEDKKFDGISIDYLSLSDIKQIAGRAGRNKETGYVTSTLESNSFIEKGLSDDIPEINKAYLGFSDKIIGINADLSDILKVWKTIKPHKLFKRMDIDRYLLLNEKVYVNVSKNEKLKMLSIPFDEGNPILLSLWKKYCIAYEEKQEFLIPTLAGNSLEDYENYYKSLELYYSFSKNFNREIDFEWLNKEKAIISEKINDILVKNVVDFQKKCDCCGKTMRWDNPFKICKSCYYLS